MALAGWMEVGRMEELARLDTPVHRLDARAKLLTTLAFLVVVMSFPRHVVSGLVPFACYPLVLISLGRIPVRQIGRKILVAAPFAVVIGLFNPLFDRQPVMTLGTLVITGGWLSCFSILLRFVLTVGAALALVACTGMYRLGSGLVQLGVPRVFVMQLLFLHRYLFVVAEEGGKMVRAVAARSGGTRTVNRCVYGSLVGHLLLRSLDRAERVYRAMVARGFDGQMPQMQRPVWRATDLAFVAGWTAFFVLARAWNLAAELGRAFSGGGP